MEMCEYLGSMRETGEDIKWRNILAIEASNQLKIIYDNKKLTPETKMKPLRVYFGPIFSCNCKIWTVTPSQAVKTINAFQRRLLRTYVLQVKWPNIVKNEDLNRSHRMEQHHSKTKTGMVWESNQNRRINTSEEGI